MTFDRARKYCHPDSMASKIIDRARYLPPSGDSLSVVVVRGKDLDTFKIRTHFQDKTWEANCPWMDFCTCLDAFHLANEKYCTVLPGGQTALTPPWQLDESWA